jgi:hypothetical protein
MATKEATIPAKNKKITINVSMVPANEANINLKNCFIAFGILD